MLPLTMSPTFMEVAPVKKILKFAFIVAFVFGGWALAAASLHVVRAPGSMCRGYIPLNVQLIPKNALTFTDTWVDTTQWSAADVDAHPAFRDRLRQANKLDLIQAAMDKPSPAQTQASAAPQGNATAPAPQKSIFDFSK
jgi:hypothetical protein